MPDAARTDPIDRPPRQVPGQDPAVLGQFARQVLAELRQGRTRGAPRSTPDALIVRLAGAAVDGRDLSPDIAAALADGWRPDALAARVIPAAARRLGRGWADETLSFAAVSAGAARLQRGLHDIARLAPPPPEARPERIAVLACPGEAHTMGAAALSLRLTRRGLRPIGYRPGPQEAVATLAGRIAADAPSAVFLSVSCVEHLDSVAHLIDALRRDGTPPPVVVGGPAVADGAAILARTGADLACSDPEEALQWCGIEPEKAPFLTAP